MTQARTRTAARRSGDDYQDLVAAEALLLVIKHPSRYRWVKLEAREAGRLDDVLVLRTDGTVEATQVKFSTDALRAGDQWTWDRLLEEPGGRRSLIQHWYESAGMLDRTYTATEPQLVSNRRAGVDLVLTPSGHVDVERTDPHDLERLREQLGTGTDDFLRRFRFDVDQPDLVDLDDRLLQEIETLGLAEGNWLSLKDAIRRWIRGEGVPETGEIRIEDIKFACGWRELSPLPQDLGIPRDYTLPLPRFHDDFLARVKAGSGSVVVLTAEPALGKSTYLSYLVHELHRSSEHVVRHHYSLGSSRDRPERLEARRVAESLMADIETALAPYMDELSTRNPNPEELDIWLREVGASLVDAGRDLILVIDGLDHVWRARRSQEELRKLFDLLIPVPPGVILVVGTQPVEDQQLPSSLLWAAPRERWIALPRLDRRAIGEWLGHHTDVLPEDQARSDPHWYRAQLAAALHKRTQGHPLLMRFVVEQVAHRGDRLTEAAIGATPETPTGSVEEYYRALWVGVPPVARDVLFLLAIARFSWPEGGLHECLRRVGYEQASASAAVRATRHLLADDGVGLSPFHSSLLLYAGRQDELRGREPDLRQAAVDWLEETAPDYWRRSHLWRMHLDAGNPAPLLAGSDREWVVSSLAAGHPLGEITDVLRAAAIAATEHGNLTTYVDRGILADSADRSTTDDDTLQWMFAAQLSLGTDDSQESRSIARIAELSARQVLLLALHLFNLGRHGEVRQCFDEVNRRIDRDPGELSWRGRERERVEVIAQLAALARVESGRFARFAASAQSESLQATVAAGWATGLRVTRDVRAAIQVLDGPEHLSAAARLCLSRYVAVVGADEHIALSDADHGLLDGPYGGLFRMFTSGVPSEVPLEEPTPPSATGRYSFEEYPGAVARYVHDLFFFLVVSEFQSPGFTDRWVPSSPLGPWLSASLTALAKGAGQVAQCRQNGAQIEPVVPYVATRHLQHPPWGDGTTDRENSIGLRRALHTITEDLLLLRHATGGSAALNRDEVETVASHTFSHHRQVLRWTAEGTAAIDPHALTALRATADEELDSEVEPFDSRAATFALLALTCARYGFPQEAAHYLRRSSESLIGYGSHKDLLLDTTLEAIEAVAGRSSERRQLWSAVAPAISSVLEYTDGDETSHLAGRLGVLLLRFDPDLAVRYVRALMDAEQHHDVEAVLRDLVRSGDLADPNVRALVSTCIDPDSIQLLEARAAGEPFAREILDLSPRYSSSLGETHEGSTPSSAADELGAGPDAASQSRQYLEFPPERLGELLRSDELTPPFYRERGLSEWLSAWVKTDRAGDALAAAQRRFFEDDRLRMSNRAVASAREIGGRSRSYAWLVRSQQTSNGWHAYWTSSEDARERWRWLKLDSPQRWREFFVESVRPLPGAPIQFGMTVGRLVEYLIYFDQWDEAFAVAWQMVATVTEQVSGQALPMPAWVTAVDEDP